MMEMENRCMVARAWGWGVAQGGCDCKGVAPGDLCRDGEGLGPDCGCGYTNTHVIQL
jgi:hypothetical protein